MAFKSTISLSNHHQALFIRLFTPSDSNGAADNNKYELPKHGLYEDIGQLTTAAVTLTLTSTLALTHNSDCYPNVNPYPNPSSQHHQTVNFITTLSQQVS